MKALSAVIALLLAASSPVLAIDHSANFSDENQFACDSDETMDSVQDIVAKTPGGLNAGAEVLYLKNQEEISRTKDKLVCRADIVFNYDDFNGRFDIIMENKDGYALMDLRPINNARVFRPRP